MNRKQRIIAKLFLNDPELRNDFSTKHATFYLKETASTGWPSLTIIGKLLKSGKVKVTDLKTKELVEASLKKWELKKDLSPRINELYLEGKELLNPYLIH